MGSGCITKYKLHQIFKVKKLSIGFELCVNAEPDFSFINSKDAGTKVGSS